MNKERTDWYWIKWVLKQPKGKLKHGYVKSFRGAFPDLESVELYIGNKHFKTIYKDRLGLRHNWIERL